MKKIQNILFGAVLLSVLSGCGRNTFCVSGHISGEAGETLYLEYLGLQRVDVIDSLVMPSSGAFRFRAARPEYPDLYRLRVAGTTIVLAVDSTESIGIEWDEELVIDGSAKSEQILALRHSLREKPIEEHKAFAKEIILQNPASMVAYYALFQQKGRVPVFDIYDKDDRIYFSAVATSFNAWMPDNRRSKVLYSQVIDVINGERRAQNTVAMQAFIEESENTFLDIVLPDENGTEQALSQYRGKVIVLDFTTTVMDRFTGYIFEMKEVYNTYHSRGLEVYEVYPDPSRLVWEEQVRALPWTTVRTENGVNNMVFATYNVQSLPTLFLFNRRGEVVGRFADFASLKQAIEKEL